MDEAQLDLVGGQTMWIPSNFPFFLSTNYLILVVLLFSGRGGRVLIEFLLCQTRNSQILVL